jgi:tetratricopeptide (TPR) repeat protein
VKRAQIILVSVGLLLFIGLLFFGKTVNPNKQITAAKPTSAQTTILFADILSTSKEKLTAEQNARLNALENSVVRGDVQNQKIHVYHELAKFWKDTVKAFEPYAYYTAEAAKLDNSEKSLTFAAQLFIDNLLAENEPAMQNWLASNGKVLLEKALEINPANDSNKISLGACYILGNISDQPMQGILPVREIATKNPDNLYAQLVLGLGGKKSGQFDKAIERFGIIVKKNPNDLGAMFQLAECYELKGDRKNAITWYQMIQKIIPNPEAKKELQDRINQLNG